MKKEYVGYQINIELKSDYEKLLSYAKSIGYNKYCKHDNFGMYNSNTLFILDSQQRSYWLFNSEYSYFERQFINKEITLNYEIC